MPETAGRTQQDGGRLVGRASLAPPGGVVPAPGLVVLKRRDYDAVREGEDLLAAARRQADDIVQKARADAEALRRKAYDEGLEEGKGQVAEQLFNAVSASVDQMASMEEAMVDLVLKSLANVLGTFDDRELVTRVVAHALRLVRDEKRVVLRVSVDDAEAVRERLDGFLAKYPGMMRIDVSPDAQLGRGGCVMETEAGVIDASLDRQLEIIAETLHRHLKEWKA